MVKVIMRKLFKRRSLFPRHAQPSLLPLKEVVSVLSLHKTSQHSNTLINDLINRDILQLTRGFDLKRHYGIKRHDRLHAPYDTGNAGTTTCRPRNDARATACHRREFMAAILERRTNQNPVATRSRIEKSLPIKINFKDLSGELEDWTTLSKVHRAQLSALGCAGSLTETAGDDPDRLRSNKPGFYWSLHARESRSLS